MFRLPSLPTLLSICRDSLFQTQITSLARRTLIFPGCSPRMPRLILSAHNPAAHWQFMIIGSDPINRRHPESQHQRETLPAWCSTLPSNLCSQTSSIDGMFKPERKIFPTRLPTPRRAVKPTEPNLQLDRRPLCHQGSRRRLRRLRRHPSHRPLPPLPSPTALRISAVG